MVDLSAVATQAQIAAMVGVSQQSISVLIAEGKLPSGLSLVDSVHAYCLRLREQAAGRLGSEVGGLDLSQERAALAREQRMGHEIKNSVARGDFSPVVALAEVLASASQAVVERFEQLPGTLKKSCPDLPDAAREQVMSAIANARNEWVRATEKLVIKAVMGDDDLEEDLAIP